MGKNNQRRQYLIDPSFQVKFIVKFCLVVIVSSLLAGALVVLLSWNSTTVAIENTRVMVKPTSDFILPVLSVTVLTVTVFSALVVMALTVLQSHRIAGPMYRFQREIDLLKQGAMDRNFSIRDKDQLQSLAKSLEEMADTLKEKHVELNNRYHVLKQFLDDKDFSVSSDDREKLRALLEGISSTLNYFKV